MQNKNPWPKNSARDLRLVLDGYLSGSSTGGFQSGTSLVGFRAIREIVVVVVVAADDIGRGIQLYGDAGEGVANKAADGKLRLLAKRRADDDTAGKAVIRPRR